MTVRELINELLDCKMDANVTVLVEIDKKTIITSMTKYGNYSYPIADDIGIETVDNELARICLKEFKQ
ncbi:MAG: hypothetical protein K6F11_08145 [Lachnospiraceae bacterium]|nr:hypothetical protein [Lachnospiraceae bacterium]